MGFLKGCLIVLAVIVGLFVLLIIIGYLQKALGKTRKSFAKTFTGKAKKEDYIRQLMNGVQASDEKERDKKCRRLCEPLTLEDLAGKELNLQMIHTLEKYRDSDFAAEAVKQASNSASLKNNVREEYFAWLLNGKKNHVEQNTFEKVFGPLTVKDFSGKTLSKKNVYCLERRLDTGFVTDIVKQAPNSAFLMKTILDDICDWGSNGYKENAGDINCAERILKAAYKKGYYTKEIKAKDGTALRRRIDYITGSCAWEHHEDEPGIYFKL